MAEKGITIVARLLGGKKIETASTEIGRSLDGVNSSAKKGEEEVGSGKGWHLFAKRQDEARKSSEKHHSFLKGAGSKVGGLLSSGAGMLGLGGAAYGAADAVKAGVQIQGVQVALENALK